MYGFVLENNKYNSLQFQVILDFNKKEEEKKKEEEQESEEEDDNKISKVIKLKNNRIRDDFFAYVRMSLM